MIAKRFLFLRRRTPISACRGLRVRTGLRAGGVIRSTLDAIPANLLSYG
jgi:hypothetical protein